MVIVNIKKEDSKKAFKKEAVFKVPKIKGYPTIRIEKGCDFQRNTNFSYSSQPLLIIKCFGIIAGSDAEVLFKFSGKIMNRGKAQHTGNLTNRINTFFD